MLVTSRGGHIGFMDGFLVPSLTDSYMERILSQYLRALNSLSDFRHDLADHLNKNNNNNNTSNVHTYGYSIDSSSNSLHQQESYQINLQHQQNLSSFSTLNLSSTSSPQIT